MKLTKKLEQEIKALMDDYWNSYMTGDLKHWGKYLPDDYRNIGGTKEEIWNSKKEILDYTKAIADQMVGMADIRNKTIQIIPYDPYLMVHEFMDMFIKVEGKFTFYGKFRLSSLIEKTTKGWKVLHQHGSYPDSKTEKGEAFAFDEIKAENIKLKDAVQRRTIELEETNQELKIEASLERVRARSLAMMCSDELLEASDTMFAELEKLSINAVRIGICTIDSKTGAAALWARSEAKEQKKNKILGVVPKGTHPVFDNMVKAWKAKKPFYTSTRKGKEVSEYYKKLSVHLSYPLPKKYNEQETISTFFFTEGSLNVLSLQPLTTTEKEIMVRFANVFGQIYTRFLDLQKAEAQARYAQIEASLERVRSRSLAMHNTSELQDVIHTVHKELLNLNIAINGGSFIAINSDVETTLRCWGSGGTADTTEEINIPLYKKPFCTNIINSIKKGPAFFIEQFTQKEKKDFFTFLFKHQPWSKLKAKEKNETLSSPGGYTRSCYVSQHTSIFIINHFGEIFSAADNDILKRFGKVFEQAYTRFLDIQKAEAQAKEAQIEAALEKVRSSSLAMHKSDELKDVVKVVFKQLQELHFGIDGAAIIMTSSEDNDLYNTWIGDDHAEYPECFKLPYYNAPTITDIWNAKKSGIDFISKIYPFKEKNIWFQYAFKNTELKNAIPEEFRKWILEQEYLTQSFAIQKNAMIGIHFHHKRVLTENETDILKRFSLVFEQGYVRFLDLLKAEAQTREAEIELALERVRARTMAMRHSDEMQDAAILMFRQTEDLGIKIMGCGFNIWDNDQKTATAWMTGLNHFQPPFKTSSSKDVFKSIYEAAKRGDAIFVKEQKGAALKAHYKYMASIPEFKKILDSLNEKGLAAPTFQIMHCTFFSQGYLMFITLEPAPDAHEIFNRFAKVFEQTYTRFLDLQKAEAQAREAQIEAALERVRSLTMGMQKSSDLFAVTDAFHQQAIQLSTNIHQSGFNLNYKETDGFNLMMADTWNLGHSLYKHIPYIDHPFFNALKEAKDMGLDFVAITLSFEEKNIWWNHFFKYLEPEHEEQKNPLLESKGFSISIALLDNVTFYFTNYDGTKFSKEENDLVKRFGTTFQQAYTRFQDLQKAEAQAREAEIQLALERVRARTMAMQKSEELSDAVYILFQQFKELGENPDQATIGVINEDEKVIEYWVTMHGNQINKVFKFPIDEPNVTNKIYNAWKGNKKSLVIDLSGKALTEFMAYRAGKGGAAINPKEKRRVIHVAFFSKGLLNVQFNEKRSEESIKLLERFASVFEQTYTRFLDLQKAEAQAREAQIEAALERVRSRSMAMHKSDELLEVINVVSEQLQHLGMKFSNASFGINTDSFDFDFDFWVAAPGIDHPFRIHLPYLDSPVFNRLKEAQVNEQSFFADSFNAIETREWMQHLFANNVIAEFTPQTREYLLSKTGFVRSSVLLRDIMLSIINYEGIQYLNDENDVFIRFANAFEQAYTRFRDLQKAEAQAREAQIEAALERVRAKAMAMHNSEDISGATVVVFNELSKLGIVFERCGIYIFNDTPIMEVWSTPLSPEHNEVVEIIAGNLDTTIHPLLDGIYKSWSGKKPYYAYELKGDEVKQYYSLLEKVPDYRFPKIAEYPERQIINTFQFNEGGIFVYQKETLSDDTKQILHRFTNVFSLTYRRYLDIIRAEAQTREAQIETGLEKVRSRTLAMQTSDELADTSIVIFEQLINLGIEPNRLFIGIINDKTHNIEAWATNEDGTKIGNHFTLNTDRNESVKKMYEGWKHKKSSITIDMQGTELQNYFHYLADEMQIPFKGGLSQKRRIQTIAYFSHGLIGMASPDEQPEATTQLLERFAAVFNLTYTRFNDLKIAEAHAIQAEEDLIKLQTEKRRAEDALTNLQAAQKQLVQSEKMASLGELTAGIAHEIQNPLNFVNNFSEVSTELLDEMKTELAIGNKQEAIMLADDVKQNLEKILHHGKRADAIVKGMLQHSNTGSGVKAPTDLNALADEYLRLSYHGFRAKDKSFNATMKTDFDETIGKINIVSQDIGRVILNLINNAFYACNQRREALHASQDENTYDPTVSISTKKINENIQISVKDNGNGIPQKIVDKIFQPFFTTKPTGQGTGLGLSLSYDIVKAHGGEIKVESKEGEGTTFNIQLNN